MTYDSFDEWFLELESFSLRSERFFEVLDRGAPYNDVVIWLRAAFDAGREGVDSESSKTGVGKTGDGDSESRIKKLADIAETFTDYEYKESEEYWGDLYNKNFARLVAADCARIAYNKSGWCGATDIKKEYGVE
jgi:hypothetical protein